MIFSVRLLRRALSHAHEGQQLFESPRDELSALRPQSVTAREPLDLRAHGRRGDRRMSLADKRIAIFVDPSLTIRLIADTIATIAIGLGAVEPAFGNMTLTDVA
jgi:hypothetical protein